MGKFDGKVVIVTGSSAGIGQATAVAFAKEGAKVTIHGQNNDRLKATEKLMLEAGSKIEKIWIVSGSVEDEDVLKKIVDETVKKFGKIDILINNVGIAQKPGTTDIFTFDNFDYVFQVNLRSVVKLSWLAMPHLEKTHGNVINVSSIGSLRPYPPTMYYTMAKAALDHFTKTMAVIYGPKGVRVNSLNPGAIETQFMMRHGISAETQKHIFENTMAPNTPMKRVGTPEEMANVLLFLASEQASYMTGSIVVADGGRSLHNDSATIDPKLLNVK
uniref:Uncharacterized protein n=1 Tax=Acrobeloides nanus TaxID=290746 RepID=A0A914DP01_9BILA